MASTDFSPVPKLFTPLSIGDMQLSHRVIMSPLTRIRCPGGLPTPLVAEYYAQRATQGGMIISEGMHPSFMVSISSREEYSLTREAKMNV
jgi:N-ethylmaleimide reductase